MCYNVLITARAQRPHSVSRRSHSVPEDAHRELAARKQRVKLVSYILYFMQHIIASMVTYLDS